MSLQTLTSNLNLRDTKTLLALAALPPAAYYLISSIRQLTTHNKPPTSRIHRSPLSNPEPTTPPPYPPNALPGARDIPTPHGSIRAYEWGPASGRKVLFVHGISTPCVALAGLAQALVQQQGCRVLLFDLFGRGYSDCPPAAQDSALWASQIAFVLGSSELAWWGEGFVVVGYSLGGGIAADWASWFPRTVRGLVLVAPAGLLRAGRVAWWSRFVYGGFLPRGLVERIVGRRLRGGSGGRQPEETKVGVVQSAEAEVPGKGEEEAIGGGGRGEGLFPGRPVFSVADVVDWQVDAHPGFVPAFISSIQNSPISGQQERWRLVGSRLDRQRLNPDDDVAAKEGMTEGKVLLMLGKDDSIIVADEIGPDAEKVLGKENVEVRVLDGGHDLPVANADGCAKAIGDFWDSI